MKITGEAIENPQMGIYPSFFVSYDLCEKLHEQFKNTKHFRKMLQEFSGKV